MWRLTLPYVRKALRERRRWLPLVAVGGFVAGLVATARSYLESRLVDHASRLMNRDSGDFLEAPITGEPGGGGDMIERITVGMLSGRSTTTVLAVYVVVTLVGVALA